MNNNRYHVHTDGATARGWVAYDENCDDEYGASWHGGSLTSCLQEVWDALQGEDHGDTITLMFRTESAAELAESVLTGMGAWAAQGHPENADSHRDTVWVRNV